MGLSRDVVRDHIDQWKEALGRSNYKYRRHWPSRLFRHEPLENAVKILTSGVLLSRDQATGMIPRDIAPADIIQHRAAAHGSVRLYFRPNSPTQFRIEGIRKPADLYHGLQAPILIILVFDAERVLTREGIRFSDANMQSYGTNIYSTDEDFQRLPFDRIYHDSFFERDSAEGTDIKRRRCAEVLIPSPLELEGNLQAILCRSSAERRTLIHKLGDAAKRWNDRIIVVTQSGLFGKQFAYMETVDAGPNGIEFTLHPRRDGATISVAMSLWNEEGQTLSQWGPRELDPANRWVFNRQMPNGRYRVRFDVERCLAYDAEFVIDEVPF